MPTVPTVDSFRATATAAPNTNFRLLDMGDAGAQAKEMGQALGNVSNAMAKIEIDQINQVNQVRVTDAMNKAIQARLRLTYDQNEGFTNLRGDAALTRPGDKMLADEYGEKYQKQLDEISQSLGTDAQRMMFSEQSGKLSQQFRNSLYEHVAKESADYRDSVFKGTIETGREQMALSWGDPEALAQSHNAIKAAVYEQGRLKGLSGVQIEANMRAQLSIGHVSVIANAVDAGKLDYAREYMKQFGTELSGNDRLKMQNVLDAGDAEKRAQETTDTLYSKHNGDITAALSEARQTLSGKDEDAVVTRLKAIDAERVTLRERAQSDAADQAWRIYAQTGSISRIPATLWTSMDGKAVEALRRTARVDADAAAAKREVKTDPSIYYALTLASAQDPNFKSEDLRGYFDKLSPADRKHFIDLQAKAQKPEEANSIVTASQQISATAKSLGFEDRQAGKFTIAANKALDSAQREKGKPLTQDERQKVLDGLVIKGEIVNPWMNSSAYRFEAAGQGRSADFRPEWTDAQKNLAREALARRGVTNPTRDQIEKTLQLTYQTK